MKKFLVFIIFVLTINSLSAQHFGIKGGLNLAKIKASSEGMSVSFDNLISFHAGIVYDTPISEKCFFNTGAIFTQKGYKFSLNESGVSMDASLKLNYIQIPLNFAIKTDVGNAKLFAQAGPFVAVALSGKEEASMSGGGFDESASADVEFGSKDNQYKRFDGGLGLGAGIEFNNVQFSINYDLGIIDIQNISQSKANTRNLYFSVCLFF